MAAPKGNQNALGNKGGGKSLQDRMLAADVRKLALDQIKKALEGKDEIFKKQLLLKLASTVLPRLNEHSGTDGEPITITWSSPSPTQPENGPTDSTPQPNVGLSSFSIDVQAKP